MKFKRSLRACLLAAMLQLLATANAANSTTNDDIDWVSVAETLLRDGAPERAESALDNVDPETEAVDLQRFFEEVQAADPLQRGLCRRLQAELLRRLLQVGQAVSGLCVKRNQDLLAAVVRAHRPDGESRREDDQSQGISQEALEKGRRRRRRRLRLCGGSQEDDGQGSPGH